MTQQFPVGSFCVIQGLQSEAGRHLNGSVGEVKAFDDQTGRLCLSLSPGDPVSEYKKLKLENLRAQRFLPEFVGSEKVIFSTEDPGIFLVRNTIQAEKNSNLGYRRTKDLKDSISGEGVRWDTTVKGHLSDGWLSVVVTDDRDHHDHDHSFGKEAQLNKGRLPVLILTGYLGAGKTTLLNYLLTEQRDKKLAVIENEVGEVSVDDALVEQKHDDLAEELVVLNNGCVCCTIRGDLVKTLHNLAAKYKDGLALDGVLIELTGAADPAPVVQTFMVDDDVRKDFYVDNVICLVDAKHAIEKLEESQEDRKEKGTACAQIAFSSTILLNKIDLVGAEELENIEKRIKTVNSTVDIIRCKQSKVEISKLFNVSVFELEKVLEEQNMDEEEFSSFYKPKMDRSISNVGVRCTGGVSMFAFQRFLGQYLEKEEDAKDFLRVKGVLHIKGSDNMFVLQCVHMLKNQSFTKPWDQAEELRENRLIFIGRGMEKRRKELTEGFMACIAQPLRFEIGAKVRARTGGGENGYEMGTVLKHWDEYNAYRIRTNAGNEIWAPIDRDCFVKNGAPPARNKNKRGK